MSLRMIDPRVRGGQDPAVAFAPALGCIRFQAEGAGGGQAADGVVEPFFAGGGP